MKTETEKTLFELLNLIHETTVAMRSPFYDLEPLPEGTTLAELACQANEHIHVLTGLGTALLRRQVSASDVDLRLRSERAEFRKLVRLIDEA